MGNDVSGRRVVVLGGGYAGCAMAAALDADFDVALVDRRVAFAHHIAGLRAAASPPAWASTALPRSGLLERGRLVLGEAVRVELRADGAGGQVALDNGDRVDFDYVVFALGSRHPCKPPPSVRTEHDIRRFYSRVYGLVSAASSVAVVGGGPAGCELAGEIATEFGDCEGKAVHLVHGGAALLNRARPPLPARVARSVEERLVALGVRLSLGRRAALPSSEGEEEEEWAQPVPGGRLRLDDGSELAVDLVLRATGARSAVPRALLPAPWAKHLQDDGLLAVNPFQQLPGAPRAFAVGDCCSVEETRLRSNADGHVRTAALAMRVHAGLASGPRTPYLMEREPVLDLALGREHGISTRFGQLFGDEMAKSRKGDLYVAEMSDALRVARASPEAEAVACEWSVESALSMVRRWGELSESGTGEAGGSGEGEGEGE